MTNLNAGQRDFGTREWSDGSYNVGIRCSHNCKYCYAANMALSRGDITCRDEWSNERFVTRTFPDTANTVMFPTAHDITPHYLNRSVAAIALLLAAGKNVLIVTKAHIACMMRMCDEFADYKNQILFRITIGSFNQNASDFWEPGAPSPGERLTAIKIAQSRGFETSVSMEPILLCVDDAIQTFWRVEPCVTETIWIGKMNSLESRVDTSIKINRQAVAYVRQCQRDSEVLRLYELFREHPKVRWKDSIMEVVDSNNSNMVKDAITS